MDVGYGCIINDKWLPKGLLTELIDINGKDIKTADKVELNECSDGYAIVGIDSGNQLMLFFGREDGVSIGWYLDQELVNDKDVRVVQEWDERILRRTYK